MERNSKLIFDSSLLNDIHSTSIFSVHIRIHLPELHEETHSHKEVIIHDDHGHGHGGGGHGHGGGDGGGFAEGLLGGFLSSGGGHGHGGGHAHGGGHGHGGHGHGGGGFGGHVSGGHGHSHGGHSQHGGHGQDDLLIATIGKIYNFYNSIER